MRGLRNFSPALMALLFALPAAAEEAAHGGGGKLPQFKEEYFAGQLFWLGVSFLLLYWLVRFVALPRVNAPQQERQALRSADLSAAALANEQAKQTIAAYEKTLAAARQQSQQKLAAIMQAAQDNATQQQQAQSRALQERLQAAEAKIAVMRTTALGQVRDAAVDVAQAMVQRLTGKSSDVAAAIDRLPRDAA